MSWAEGLRAIVGTVGILFSLIIQVAWLYIAWRVLSWVMYERSTTERNPAKDLKFAVRRIVCRHKKGYAQVRDGYGRNYLACAFCGEDVNRNRRPEDRV